jgi:phage terminase small subunit
MYNNEEIERIKRQRISMSTRRKMFIEEYLRDDNGTQAAIRVGYAEKSANLEAH